ncbi:uncharacterized protein LOC129589549 [Paramacrobiotus metropolitanus]|uniref:uncharacterized protein LOC129589549 n=1 Tax=Paramacrobiotus metropolitanus TaxID=2943436 RepID=UPI0024458A12|nr:uncharacterized protein LOC129589549 [Paramacrobiotus metropolitanus]
MQQQILINTLFATMASAFLMKTELFVLFCFLVAAVFFDPASAIADNEDVEITEDLFNTPLSFSDVNAIAKTGPRLWPNPTAIPYYMSTYSLNQTEQQVVLKTLRTMERRTKGCILFKPRTNETDYLYFQGSSTGKCSTDLGRTGGYQDVNLGSPSYLSSYYTSPCFSPGDIQMVIMRALGFDYEHKRPDRDQYVEVRNSSIDSDYFYSSYAINPNMYTFGTKYDYESILHYFTWANALGRNPGMIARKGLTARMGRRKKLSPTDVAKIMLAYNCPPNVTRGTKQPNADDDFPKFSLEKMTDEECGAQFNRYCKSDITTTFNCTDRTDFRIVCRSNASLNILARMAVDMAEPPLRMVSMDLEEQLIVKYSFAPIQRQVVKLQLRNCTTERVTSRLVDLNFTSMLDFQLYDARNLVIVKKDFTTSKRLRIVIFYNTTIKTMQQETFTDLPNLQILSLEALFEDQKYYNFDQSFRSFLQNLHCSCEFAWYRSWWRKNKKLRMRAQIGDIYSFDGRYSDEVFDSSGFGKEDLYHPVNCRADPFPFGTEWINYYTQIDYSVNEPPCDASIMHGSNAVTTAKITMVTKSPSTTKTTSSVIFSSTGEPVPAETVASDSINSTNESIPLESSTTANNSSPNETIPEQTMAPVNDPSTNEPLPTTASE